MHPLHPRRVNAVHTAVLVPVLLILPVGEVQGQGGAPHRSRRPVPTSRGRWPAWEQLAPAGRSQTPRTQSHARPWGSRGPGGYVTAMYTWQLPRGLGSAPEPASHSCRVCIWAPTGPGAPVRAGSRLMGPLGWDGARHVLWEARPQFPPARLSRSQAEPAASFARQCLYCALPSEHALWGSTGHLAQTDEQPEHCPAAWLCACRSRPPHWLTGSREGTPQPPAEGSRLGKGGQKPMGCCLGRGWPGPP